MESPHPTRGREEIELQTFGSIYAKLEENNNDNNNNSFIAKLGVLANQFDRQKYLDQLLSQYKKTYFNSSLNVEKRKAECQAIKNKNRNWNKLVKICCNGTAENLASFIAEHRESPQSIIFDVPTIRYFVTLAANNPNQNLLDILIQFISKCLTSLQKKYIYHELLKDEEGENDFWFTLFVQNSFLFEVVNDLSNALLSAAAYSTQSRLLRLLTIYCPMSFIDQSEKCRVISARVTKNKTNFEQLFASILLLYPENAHYIIYHHKLYKILEKFRELFQIPYLKNYKDILGKTWLHHAAESNFGVDSFIGICGQDAVDTLDIHGRTALYYAVIKNREEATRILIQNGANPQLVDVDIVKLAVDHQAFAVANYLLSQGFTTTLNVEKVMAKMPSRNLQDAFLLGRLTAENEQQQALEKLKSEMERLMGQLIQYQASEAKTKTDETICDRSSANYLTA